MHPLQGPLELEDKVNSNSPGAQVTLMHSPEVITTEGPASGHHSLNRHDKELELRALARGHPRAKPAPSLLAHQLMFRCPG